MIDKVVINFTEQGLDDIVADLVKIGAINEKQAAEYKKSNDEHRTRQEIVSKLFASQSKLSTEVSKTAKSMDDLAKASVNASKNITNGATNEAIKKTNQLIDQTNTEVKKYDSSLKGLKQQYRDLVAEAIRVGETSPFGEKLLKEAGEVKDRIGDIQATTKNFGSDTATFNAIGQGIRGIGAGFEIAQGAQALFGEGNKDLEKQLVKIQATMALVNGLTEIQEALQAESSLRLGIVNAQTAIKNGLQRAGITIKTQSNVAEGTGEVITKRVIAVQTIENALQSESIVLRGLATAAQWLLNAAVYAFPLIALVAGLTAVVALLANYGTSLEDVAKRQTRLNEIEAAELEVLKAITEQLDQNSKVRQEAIQREIDLLKVKGASTEIIRQKEQLLYDEIQRNAAQSYLIHSEEIKNLKINEAAIIGVTAKIKSLTLAQGEGKGFEEQIKAATGELENLKTKVEEARDAQERFDNTIYEGAKLNREQQKAIELEGLAAQKAMLSSKLRFAKEASDQQLAFQLALAKNERDTAIASLKATNESTADIEAAYEDKRLQLIETFNNVQLQKKLSLVNAELQAVRIGSNAELDLKLRALEIENEADLNNRKLTDEKRREITAKYLKQTRDMVADFAKKQRDDEINTQLLINDARMQGVEKASLLELSLKQQQLALQEQLELNNIDRNIQGTALGEAKKNDIIALYAQKNKQLELDAIEAVISAREEENNRIGDVLQRRADLEASNINTTIERKQQLELEAFDNKLTLLEKEKNANTERYVAGTITYEQYQKNLTRIQDEESLNRIAQQNAYDQIEIENFQRKSARIAELGTQTITILTQANDAYLAYKLNGYNEEAKNNEDLYNRKIITEKQYAANKKDIDKKVAEEKRKAAEKEKALALIQILINTAASIIKTGGELGYPAAIPFQILAGALGVVQYAAVASKPIPEFAKGTKSAPKGWAWVGEKGPELVWMKGGEEVKTHEESMRMTRQMAPSIRTSYSDKVDRGPVPSKQAEQAMAILASQGAAIDYAVLSKLIGNEVGNHLSKMPLTMMSFDKHGFRASIIEGNSTTNFMDSRYSS